MSIVSFSFVNWILSFVIDCASPYILWLGLAPRNDISGENRMTHRAATPSCENPSSIPFVFLPPPYKPVLRIHHFTNTGEPKLLKHPHGGIPIVPRMGTHHAHPIAAHGVV